MDPDGQVFYNATVTPPTNTIVRSMALPLSSRPAGVRHPVQTKSEQIHVHHVCADPLQPSRPVLAISMTTISKLPGAQINIMTNAGKDIFNEVKQNLRKLKIE